MNERIKVLAEQAGLAQGADVRAGYIYPEGMEKFAELIVRECGQIAYYEETDSGNKIRFMILEHFGIE